MKKKILSAFLVFFSLIFCFIGFNSYNLVSANEEIFLGGMPVGLTLETKGAYIIGLTDVITENGIVSPAKESGITVGDVIIRIDDLEVNSALEIEKCIKNDSLIKVDYVNNGVEKQTLIQPAKDLMGKFRLGVFIRDKINGIGTVTFIKGNRIATLGHPVLQENGELLEIIDGSIFNCKINGYIKGERGKPGELKGIINKEYQLGTIDKNIISGVYGNVIDENSLTNLEKIEISSAKPGKASIYTTIDGNTPCEYSISIIKADLSKKIDKNYVIKIDDERLLDSTGGIVQGMSGSPIVQDGKLVGAVTHVFINDPTRGFGISIENMINN